MNSSEDRPARDRPVNQSAPPRSVRIDRATADDARAIADVLTVGFDSGGWIEALLRPFWHFALYDDARNRLDGSAAIYACWLAVRERSGDSPPATPGRPETPNQQTPNQQGTPLGTVELSVRPFGTWNRDTWFWQMGRDRCPYIANLAVIPTARRLGIASRLLDRCEQTAAAWGYDRIYLHVMADNERALRLYRQRDYRPQPSPSPIPWWANPKQILMCKVLTRSARRDVSPRSTSRRPTA